MQHSRAWKAPEPILSPLLDFLEVMYFCTTGGEKGQKREFCCAKKFFFFPLFPFHSFPFVCALIGEPSLFRWGALFMTQPQTRSLKAPPRVHTHTHTHTQWRTLYLPYQDNQGSPDTNLVSWVSRRSSLTLAFPHKLKLNEREQKKVAVAFEWKSKSLINHVSRHSAHTPVLKTNVQGRAGC